MLSHRLKIISSFLKKDSSVIYDLCCDHGYLGEYFLSQGYSVIFIDKVQHIINELSKRLINYPKASFKAQSILDLKEINSNSSIFLCGVGSELAAKFIDSTSLELGQRLIVSTHGSMHKLINSLHRNKLTRVKETIIEDDGVFYEVFVCDKDENYKGHLEINSAHFKSENNEYTKKQLLFYKSLKDPSHLSTSNDLAIQLTKALSS